MFNFKTLNTRIIGRFNGIIKRSNKYANFPTFEKKKNCCFIEIYGVKPSSQIFCKSSKVEDICWRNVNTQTDVIIIILIYQSGTVNNFDFLQALLFDVVLNKEIGYSKNDFFCI